MDRWINEYMPIHESGKGFKPLTFVKSYSMTLYGGEICIEDIKEIKTGFGMEHMPLSQCRPPFEGK